VERSRGRGRGGENGWNRIGKSGREILERGEGQEEKDKMRETRGEGQKEMGR
jgi:hypothetical protein